MAQNTAEIELQEGTTMDTAWLIASKANVLMQSYNIWISEKPGEYGKIYLEVSTLNIDSSGEMTSECDLDPNIMLAVGGLIRQLEATYSLNE